MMTMITELEDAIGVEEHNKGDFLPKTKSMIQRMVVEYTNRKKNA